MTVGTLPACKAADARSPADPALPRPFRLLRWFAATAALSTLLSTVMLAVALSHFLQEWLVWQDARTLHVFIQHEVSTLGDERFFAAGDPSALPTLELREMLAEIASMPSVLRTNVYDATGRLLWSSDPVRRRVGPAPNPPLQRALAGEMVVEHGSLGGAALAKAEHAGLDATDRHFVETYMPVRSNDGQRIIGVFELYKAPHELFDMIGGGVRRIWLASAASGLLLFAMLIGLVRRAQRTMDLQHARLAESEAWAMTGAMGIAVAHGVRNPLAVIRSSAELLRGADPDEVDAHARDILATVDRLGTWVRRLLDVTRPLDAGSEGKAGHADVVARVRERLDNFRGRLTRQGIACRLSLDPGLPLACIPPPLLETVVDHLVENAIDAMPGGGLLAVSVRHRPEGRITLTIEDDGAGMEAGTLARIGQPFVSTKPDGLGLGLPIACRLVERSGGTFSVDSAPGAGTRVTVTLAACMLPEGVVGA